MKIYKKNELCTLCPNNRPKIEEEYWSKCKDTEYKTLTDIRNLYKSIEEKYQVPCLTLEFASFHFHLCNNCIEKLYNFSNNNNNNNNEILIIDLFKNNRI